MRCPSVDPAIQPFVIPPFTARRQVKAALAETRVKVGAQNMHWEDHGAWTGEISPLMLKDCGLDMVELGHSERREHFGETNRTVGLKTAAALRHGLLPLVCVGETLAERDAGRAEEVLREQVLARWNFLDSAALGQPILLRLRAGMGDRRQWHSRERRLRRKAAADDQATSRRLSCLRARRCSTAAASIPAMRPN